MNNDNILIRRIKTIIEEHYKISKNREFQYELELLIEKYGIDQNKGYGAKRHLDGIKEHGITIWHRRSFGICKSQV